MRMVQASALLAAITLTVTVPSYAVDVPTCAEVRAQAAAYSWAQIKAMAKRHKLSPQEWAALRECLKDKK